MYNTTIYNSFPLINISPLFHSGKIFTFENDAKKEPTGALTLDMRENIGKKCLPQLGMGRIREMMGGGVIYVYSCVGAWCYQAFPAVTLCTSSTCYHPHHTW